MGFREREVPYQLPFPTTQNITGGKMKEFTLVNVLKELKQEAREKAIALLIVAGIATIIEYFFGEEEEI
jgi:hypothetical protein